MRRSAALGVGMLGLVLAGCGSASETEAMDGGAGATIAIDEAAADDAIDTQALLDRFGFEVCDGTRPAGQITRERATEIVHAAVDAGIASGGGGGEGYKGSVELFALDEPSLATLADIADPSKICVDGQDPNDYVALGPQALTGPGWRWIGAGSTRLANQLTLIASQSEYDQLWSDLGEGPEIEQLPVDLTEEVILAISHGGGVNFGRCGQRFDGYTVDNGVVVIDWFEPGGMTGCDAIAIDATYVVALDLETVGLPPLTIARRHGPRQEARDRQLVDVGTFATTTIPTEDQPVTEPTTTTVGPVPPTAAPVVAEIEPGAVSMPTWEQRGGSLAEIGFDLPVPSEWQSSSGPGSVRSSIVGRGELLVESYASDDPAWRAKVNPGPDAEITNGPVALAIPTHRIDGTNVVTSGETIIAHEYRFASTTSFLTQTARWYEHGDTIVVATLSYPDPDRVPESLTGLDPKQLLDDIRIRR